MVSNNRYVPARPVWFVRAAWDGINQTDRFLAGWALGERLPG